MKTPVLPLLMAGSMLLAGCNGLGSHQITSTPSGAHVWSCSASQSQKPDPDGAEFRYKGTTPWARYDGPQGSWYQVRLKGYQDSEVSFLPLAFFTAHSHHFTLHEQKSQSPSPASGLHAMPETRRVDSATLPKVNWPVENIAVVDLMAYALSQAEAKTLTEELQTALVETKYFNVLSRSDMKAVLDAQQFSRTDACDDSACLVEIGKILAVQMIVGGSIGKVGSTYSLAVRLVNVETGKTEITADRKLKAEPDELLDLVQEAAREVALKYAETKKIQ